MSRNDWKDTPGPWQGEPESLAFTHAGLECRVLRGPFGSWNGYVRVPAGHPWHGVSYHGGGWEDKTSPEMTMDVHGGLTYSGTGVRGMSDSDTGEGAWWFGFDTAHYGDYAPGLSEVGSDGDYRDADYVRRECERLAEQLAAKSATNAPTTGALTLLLAALLLTLPSCSHRAAPVYTAKVQAQVVDCAFCSSYGYRDCRDRGGWTGRWHVVEYLDYSAPYELYQKAACEVECESGVIVSHACKQDPPDWRVAEVRQ